MRFDEGMKLSRRTTLIAAGIAALAVAGGGGALAATQLTPKQERQAVLNDAAKQLGVTPAKLESALKQALKNRVDAAVADGRLTQAQANELKARIDAGSLPFFGPRGFDHRGGPHLDAAAAYLGLSAAELRAQLESGKTLAQVAQARGKSVSGLVDALVADEKQELAAAVADGRITQAQADRHLARARERFEELVNRTPRLRGGFGFRGFRNGHGF